MKINMKTLPEFEQSILQKKGVYEQKRRQNIRKYGSIAACAVVLLGAGLVLRTALPVSGENFAAEGTALYVSGIDEAMEELSALPADNGKDQPYAYTEPYTDIVEALPQSVDGAKAIRVLPAEQTEAYGILQSEKILSVTVKDPDGWLDAYDLSAENLPTLLKAGKSMLVEVLAEAPEGEDVLIVPENATVLADIQIVTENHSFSVRIWNQWMFNVNGSLYLLRKPLQ